MFRSAATLVTALAAALTIGGTTASAAPAGPARAPGHSTEHFVFMGTSTKTGVFSVISTGLFTDGGTINIFSPAPQIRLSGGDLRFRDHDRPPRYTFSKATCLLTITGRGTYNLSHGTGKYRNITGSGSFTTRGRILYPRKPSGTCARSHPVAFQAIVTLNGPVTKHDHAR